MLERPLVYLVPAASVGLYCAVCLDVTPGLYPSLLLSAFFLIGTGALVYHDRLFSLMGMLAAVALAFAGFALFQMIVVDPASAPNCPWMIMTYFPDHFAPFAICR